MPLLASLRRVAMLDTTLARGGISARSCALAGRRAGQLLSCRLVGGTRGRPARHPAAQGCGRAACPCRGGRHRRRPEPAVLVLRIPLRVEPASPQAVAGP